MPVYCNEGEIARVTLPDGSVQDFPGPIDIEIVSTNVDCNLQYLVLIDYTSAWRGDPSNFTASSFQIWCYPPVVDVFFVIINTSLGIDIISRQYGNDCWPQPIQVRVLTSGQTIGGTLSWQIINQRYTKPWLTPSYKISIYSLEGILLFSSTYESNNYLVECVAGCSENEIDCGDCCLPCDEVLDRVCNLKLLFIG